MQRTFWKLFMWLGGSSVREREREKITWKEKECVLRVGKKSKIDYKSERGGTCFPNKQPYSFFTCPQKSNNSDKSDTNSFDLPPCLVAWLLVSDVNNYIIFACIFFFFSEIHDFISHRLTQTVGPIILVVSLMASSSSCT